MSIISTDYRRNHYVPHWYQRRFLPDDGREPKFYYHDLRPDHIPGTNKKRNDVLRWGAKRCFVEDDLYTVRLGQYTNVDIEKFFFGHIDRAGEKSIDYFTNFQHPGASEDAFHDFLNYMSVQKLRTPKGLRWLSQQSLSQDRHVDLILMQKLQNTFCALWSECVWQIADASQSATKFIISDHPVTVYNRACFPFSKHCAGYNDPDIWQVATHTLFPLSLDKIIILTNLAWVRNPYQSEFKPRPNPNMFRDAVFNFMDIQTNRLLSEQEVREINFIIKRRAYRYIAAAEKEWLYPEKSIPDIHWRKLGQGYLLMPDPRPISMGGEVIIGYNNGKSDAFSEYGHKPWQQGFRDAARYSVESRALDRFKGEFSRLFGPKKRGRTCRFTAGNDSDEYDPEYHAYHLGLEKSNNG